MILNYEILIGISIAIPTRTRTMFAYLRSNESQTFQDLAIKMRDNVRNQMALLTDIDHTKHSRELAEIYMREFACTCQTLKQVNVIATLYHEHAFDNTDAYLQDIQQQPQQLSPHEMTSEQRNASQLLVGVGNNYREINVALNMLECGILMRDIMECDGAKIEIVAQQFRINPVIIEDAFNRLHHITKHVWSLVNILAFSNLFRFADPTQHISIPNQNDAIFIPYIPTKQYTE